MAIAHFANMEIGWIAVGIGFLVGISVRLAAHRFDIDESPTLGVYAAAVAVGSIALAKYGIYYMNVVALALAKSFRSQPCSLPLTRCGLDWLASPHSRSVPAVQAIDRHEHLPAVADYCRLAW